MKESWVNLLYNLGQIAGEGNYAPAGSDDSADLTGWKALLDAGEPYDGRPETQAILDDITKHHSSYYIDHSVAPAPLLISNGFTDDLFPVDEAIRFYNRTRAQYPGNPIGLFLNPNSGHMRGMSKADVPAAQKELENKWVDFYLKGAGSKPPAADGGYTVLGSPTVVAGIKQAGGNSQIAARLVDVSPDGLSKILIARGVWRPASGTQVFQLHANGYKVETGHVARLELLAKDASGPAGAALNYVRPSNGQTEATITNLDLRIPVAEEPGALDGLVTKPAPKVLPNRPGVELAPGYGKIGSVPVSTVGKKRLQVVGKLKANGKKLKVRVRCAKSATTCPKTALVVRKGKAKIASRKGITVGKGKTKTVSLKLTRKARKLMSSKGRNLKGFKAKVTIRTNGLKKRTVTRTVKRVGKVR
ncbi:MAG: hypothetical protein JJE13_02110 [Thermoleophilia bacterium]|nr:hypothetical protein [Thermoleophilia bacterium]